jgi:DNA-binding MarR family transcriptional regulator
MVKEPGSDPKRDLAHRLTLELFDLGIVIDLIGQATASRLGINQTDLICLNMLTRNGPMSSGQVASALGLTTAAISAMASRLEAGGYARREMDPKDRRRVLLHPLPDGVTQAFRLFDDFFEATSGLCAAYPEKDVRTLLDMLARFRATIADHASILKG